MRGFTIQKLYQAGKVSEKEIYGNYDGKKAQFVAVNDGKMEKGSLTNRDIATLLSLRASPHSLVERLEHDLGRGQHRRRRTRRHRRRRHKKKHTRKHHKHSRQHHKKKTHRRRKHKTRRRR
jgi:hypothetical protein